MSTAMQKQSEQLSPDQRKESRRRALKSARIIFANYSLSYDCLIKDVSENGARIKLGGEINIPSRFFLFTPADQKLRDVEMIWRDGTHIGVTFLSEAEEVYTSDDPRVSRLVQT